MKIRSFKNETFDFWVTLLWPCTPEQFQKHVCGLGFTCRDDVGSFTALCHSEQSNHIIGFKAWTGSVVDLGVLAHEVFHVTSFALKECDTRLTDDTEEIFAYLQGSLFEHCARLLK